MEEFGLSNKTVWSDCLQSLLNQAIQRSLRLEEKIRELHSARYASEAPSFLMKLLSDLNGELLNGLKSICETTSSIEKVDEITYTTQSKEIRSYCQALADLYSYISLVESSQAGKNLTSISVSIARLSNELVPNNVTLVCPVYSCNYCYFDILLWLKKVVERFFSETKLSGYPKYFAFFGFPHVIRDDILCHSLLGHELGHFVGTEHNIFQDALKDVPLSSLTANLTASLTAIPLTLLDLQKIFEEYVCDIVSVYLFGLAPLFTLIEFGTSVINLTDLALPHPPLSLRVSNILTTLEHYGYKDFFSKNGENAIANTMLSTLQNLGVLVSETQEMIEPLAMDILHCLEIPLKKARELIESRIDKRFQLKLDKHIFECVKLIEEGVPPSSILNSKLDSDQCQPTELGFILNAGWFYRIMYLQNTKPISLPLQECEHAKQLKDLCRLIDKAVEQSETIYWYNKRGEEVS